MKRTPLRRAKKMRVKSSKRKQKQALDLQFREEVFARDGFHCVVPESQFGKHGGCLQAAHIYPKGVYGSLRHNLNNLLTMCYRHHIHGWHKNPIEYSDWFRSEYPDRAILLATLKNL